MTSDKTGSNIVPVEHRPDLGTSIVFLAVIATMRRRSSTESTICTEFFFFTLAVSLFL